MQKIIIIGLLLVSYKLSNSIENTDEYPNPLLALEPDLSNIYDKINKNYYSFDTVIHKQIISELENYTLISKGELNYEHFKFYALALEYHILGKILYVPNPKLAEDYFDKSIEYLEIAIEKSLEPYAHYFALLSSAYGKKASLSTFSAFYWGYKSRDAYLKAYELDSNSSKVLLIGAIHLMHVPESFGGDKNKAEEMLLKCIDLNNNYELFTGYSKWAKNEEIYAYLAQLEILKGNKVKAEKYIVKALQIRQNYDFVLIDLKKQLEEM